MKKENLTFEEIYDKYNGLVYKVILTRFGKIRTPVYDVDDLLQEGFIALLESYEKWDPDKSSFTSFAYNAILWRAYNTLRTFSKYCFNQSNDDDNQFILSLDYIIEDTENCKLVDAIKYEPNDIIFNEILSIVKDLTKNKCLYNEWYAHYVLGMRLTDIAKLKGVSKQSVSQRVKSLNNKVKKRLIELGYHE